MPIGWIRIFSVRFRSGSGHQGLDHNLDGGVGHRFEFLNSKMSLFELFGVSVAGPHNFICGNGKM
jgi:hypothetical protein